eukprot:m.80946 g.80946  ORF g.80946 m.80946 type:complete len:483 (-) comp19423_c0_seq3:280-1728(-)
MVCVVVESTRAAPEIHCGDSDSQTVWSTVGVVVGGRPLLTATGAQAQDDRSAVQFEAPRHVVEVRGHTASLQAEPSTSSFSDSFKHSDGAEVAQPRRTTNKMKLPLQVADVDLDGGLWDVPSPTTPTSSSRFQTVTPPPHAATVPTLSSCESARHCLGTSACHTLSAPPTVPSTICHAPEPITEAHPAPTTHTSAAFSRSAPPPVDPAVVLPYDHPDVVSTWRILEQRRVELALTLSAQRSALEAARLERKRLVQAEASVAEAHVAAVQPAAAAQDAAAEVARKVAFTNNMTSVAVDVQPKVKAKHTHLPDVGHCALVDTPQSIPPPNPDRVTAQLAQTARTEPLVLDTPSLRPTPESDPQLAAASQATLPTMDPVAHVIRVEATRVASELALVEAAHAAKKAQENEVQATLKLQAIETEHEREVRAERVQQRVKALGLCPHRFPWRSTNVGVCTLCSASFTEGYKCTGGSHLLCSKCLNVS